MSLVIAHNWLSSFVLRPSSIVGCYLQLTKPRIIFLFALTGFTALVMEGSVLGQPALMCGLVLMIAACGGAANAFNQYLERDLDAKMTRTSKKRPLPQGRISPKGALVFSVLLSLISVAWFFFFTHWLGAMLAAATILFYSWFYTVWLKPRTPYNIVIGGAAGAAAPLIAWGAVTGEVSVVAWILFLIVFFWTPPHFWALALCYKDDYAKVGMPMLPVVKGDEATRRQIFFYAALLLPISLSLVLLNEAGWIYFCIATIAGLVFIYRAAKLFFRKSNQGAFGLFGFSIVYLFLLFVGLIADRMIMPAHAAEPLPRELEGIGVDEQLGRKIDLDLTFQDEAGQTIPLRTFFTGKPVVLSLVYYGCPNLCQFLLNGLTESLKKLDWTVGNQFDIAHVSIDPSEGPVLARNKRASHLKEYGREVPPGAWHYMVGKGENIRRLADQIGFRYRYDEAEKQYAHAAMIVIVTPEGKISRYLHGIQFKPRDLKFALLEGGEGKVGNIVEKFMLFCYRYDPQTKKYALFATRLMQIGGGLTVAGIGLLLLGLKRKGKKACSV